MNEQQFQRMTTLFRQSGFELANDDLKAFSHLYDRLIEFTEEYDLTRIRKFDDIIIKHFIDSIYVSKLIKLPASLVDIGTGPGFPGIPLKIVNPDLSIILAEPKHRRIKFMNMIIDELKLDNAVTHAHKVDENSFFKVDGVITRAFEKVDSTMSRVKHFLAQDGLIIFMKGPGVDEELDYISPENIDDFSLELDRSYILPGTTHKRRLVVFRKQDNKQKIIYNSKLDQNIISSRIITSTENKQYKEFKRLNETDYVKKSGRTIVTGKKLILELASRNPGKEDFLILPENYSETNPYFNLLINEYDKAGQLLIFKKNLYNEIDTLKTNAPLLITTYPSIKEWPNEEMKGCSVVIPFQDPQNVGAAIRSAAAFNADRIILLKEGANPFSPKAIRSSSGTVFNIPIYRGPGINELQNKLKETALPILVLDKGGSSIVDYKFPDNFMLLAGLEGPGIPDELKEHSLSIPIADNVESLNGATALSLVLYEWSRNKL